MLGGILVLLTCSTKPNHEVEDVFIANCRHASKMARAVKSPRVSCIYGRPVHLKINPDSSSELSYARICHEPLDLT